MGGFNSNNEYDKIDKKSANIFTDCMKKIEVINKIIIVMIIILLSATTITLVKSRWNETINRNFDKLYNKFMGEQAEIQSESEYDKVSEDILYSHNEKLLNELDIVKLLNKAK